MFSAASRISRVFKGTKADAVLIRNAGEPTSNFLYLTGFTSGVFEGDELIVLPGREILLTGSLEYETALRQRPKEMKVIEIASLADIKKRLSASLKGKTVGIDGRSMSYNAYKAFKKLSGAKRFVDVSLAFSAARAVKEEHEIACMAKASRIVKKMLAEIPSHFEEGMTELQLAAKVDYLMRMYGASGPSFKTIVCFGENSSLPHHSPTTKRLSRNSFVLIDCGAKYANYCSDVTRTFIFKPDKGSAKYGRMLEVLETVKKAQWLGMREIRAGAIGSAAHNAAAEYIDTVKNGRYKGRFIHSLGHPVGIDVHDVGTSLSPSSKEKLRENMVVSNEPGIYIPGFGGVRIEDDVLVTKNGPKVL